MKNLFLYLIFTLLILSATAHAQTASEELTRLREHLQVEPTTQIALAIAPELPTGSPLKIYVATGLDMKVREKFTEWIANWNKKEAKEYGEVEQVGDIAQADVVLSRYTLQESLTTRTHSSVGSATVYDPATNSTITRPVTRTYSYNQVPVYLYILARKGEGFEILWRETSQTTPGDYRTGGYSMRDEFNRMMKARAKAQKR